eukprot:scaffold9073_cov180-Skeletonema_dohrnii-CCMP3373.AAC.6
MFSVSVSIWTFKVYHRIAIQPWTMGKAQQTLNQTFSPTLNYQHRKDASFHKAVKFYLIHKASKKAIDREIMCKERSYLDITATTVKFLNNIDELGICISLLGGLKQSRCKMLYDQAMGTEPHVNCLH